MSTANQTPAPQARNALRHGLTSGQLPKGAAYIARMTADFRAALEDACIARHGQVSLTMAATIQSIVRWERHSLLCQRWLRVHPGLTADQQMAFSRDAARASSERDKLLRVLDLDGAEMDPMLKLKAEFDALPAWEPPQPHTAATNATETASETPAAAEPSSGPEDNCAP